MPHRLVARSLQRVWYAVFIGNVSLSLSTWSFRTSRALLRWPQVPRGTASFDRDADYADPLSRELMIRQSVAMGLAVCVGVTWTSFRLGAEESPVPALTIEQSIPFKVTSSHRNNYDTYVAFGFDSLWTVVHPALVRIDPATGESVAIELKGVAGPVRFPEFGGGAVWIADTGTNTVYKVDPATNAVSLTFRANMLSAYSALAFGDGSLWMVTAENAERTLTRFDPSTGEVQAKIGLPSTNIGGVIFDFGAAWVPGATNNEVYRIDPKSNRISTTIPTCPEPSLIASGAETIWINCRGAGIVNRIDAATGKVVASLETDSRGQEQFAFGEGFVWLTTRTHALIQIDPRENRIVKRFSAPELRLDHKLSYGAGSLWMMRISPKGAILRIRSPLKP